MNNRNNQLLMGIIVFLIGLFCLFQKYISFDLVSVSFVALGFAFILLYRTKRKSWSLLLGAFLMFFGLNEIILAVTASMTSLNLLADSLFQSMFLIVPGIVFLILFYDKNKNGLLVPGSILIALGTNGAVNSVFFSLRGFSFYLIMSVCFYYIYNAGRYFIGRWPLYISGIMLFLFATKLLTLI